LACERDKTLLDRVLELAMTALRSHVLPPVGFEKLLDFPYLHNVRISGSGNLFAGLTISSSAARRKERSD
jgi:hypothetical protein